MSETMKYFFVLFLLFLVGAPLSAYATAKQPIILIDVPFTSQAPFGEWKNPVYEYGCEEASIVMAMRWVSGKALTKKSASREIAALAAFEKKKYGYYEDSSATDTARLIRDYYRYRMVSVREDITLDNIIAELKKGNILIVPVNGQKVKNPYYTPPGPVEHMMVVLGYDPNTRELIVNDPGTRRGKAFRYSTDVFERAMQDYPSGFKEPISEKKRVMIIISKKKAS